MTLYLMRHSESEDGERMDPTRPLTETGRKQTATMAAFMARQIGRVDLVVTSWFKRAVDTAEPMGKALGCEDWRRTWLLQPDTSAGDAWQGLQEIIGDAQEVLAISHHPLVDDLLELLVGAKTDDIHFHHANIAALTIEDPPGHRLHWLVNPQLVERDEQQATVEAALKVADAALEMAEADPAPLHEALKHPRHMKTLAPLRAKAKEILAAYFQRQKKKLVKELRPRIRIMLEERESGMSYAGLPPPPPFFEAAEDEAARKKANRYKADKVVADSLNPLRFKLTAEQEDDYSGLLRDAITGAAAELAKEMANEATLSDDAVAAYLRDHSLTKLTGNVAAETKEQLANAIAGSYGKGGTFPEIVQAIEDSFDQASEYRAQMIAQTEMNDAYNEGRLTMADEMGLEEKAWDPDGEACERCMEQVDAGWIPIDEDFPGGVDAPTLHPQCDCTLSFRGGVA